MKTIRIENISNRDCVFFDNKIEIGRLVYPDWYSSKAEIKTSHKTTYTIEKQGFFNQNYLLKENEILHFSHKGNWKSHVIITDAFNHHEYTLRMKGFFNSEYILTDHHGKEVISIVQKFTWKKFRPSYEMTLHELNLYDQHNEILIYLTLFCYSSVMTALSSAQ